MTERELYLQSINWILDKLDVNFIATPPVILIVKALIILR